MDEKPDRRMVAVALDTDIILWLNAECHRLHTSRSKVIRDILDKHIECEKILRMAAHYQVPFDGGDGLL